MIKKSIYYIYILCLFTNSIFSANILFYISANNNLSHDAERTIQNIRFTKLKHNILVEINKKGTSYRYNTVNGYLKKFTSFENENAANINKIKNFFSWADYRLIPNEKVIIIFYGHGIEKNGSSSFLYDDYYNDRITFRELGKLFYNIENIVNIKIDWVLFDGCNLGNITFLYEIKDYAKYFIASPFEVSGIEINYEDMFKTNIENILDIKTKLSNNYYLYSQEYINNVASSLYKNIKENNIKYSDQEDLLKNVNIDNKNINIFFPNQIQWNNEYDIIRTKIKDRFVCKILQNYNWYKICNKRFGDKDTPDMIKGISKNKVFENYYKITWEDSFDVSGIKQNNIMLMKNIERIDLENYFSTNFIFNNNYYETNDDFDDDYFKITNISVDSSYKYILNFEYLYYLGHYDSKIIFELLNENNNSLFIKEINGDSYNEWNKFKLDLSKYDSRNLIFRVLVKQKGYLETDITSIKLKNIYLSKINNNDIQIYEVDSTKNKHFIKILDNINYFLSIYAIDNYDKSGEISKIHYLKESDIKNTDLKVYPNPFNRYLNILYKTKKLEKLIIYDIKGRKLKEAHLQPTYGTSKKIRINMKHFAAGVYYINVGKLIKKAVLIK